MLWIERPVGILASGFQPIPNYVMAFVVLIIFGFIWPVLPISGGYRMNLQPQFSFEFIWSVVEHSLLPALSREFLKRSLAKEKLKEAKVTIENDDFAYGWA